MNKKCRMPTRPTRDHEIIDEALRLMIVEDEVYRIFCNADREHRSVMKALYVLAAIRLDNIIWNSNCDYYGFAIYHDERQLLEKWALELRQDYFMEAAKILAQLDQLEHAGRQPSEDEIVWGIFKSISFIMKGCIND